MTVIVHLLRGNAHKFTNIGNIEEKVDVSNSPLLHEFLLYSQNNDVLVGRYLVEDVLKLEVI